LYAVSKAARHVAGDFFDFFLINPKQLVFVIADVSGKGMAAALVMAVTRTIIRNLAQSGKSPAAILTETNELLRESHSGAAFVTIFLGIYNTNNGRIQYANGGHSSCLMIDKQGKVTPMGAATGTIVGMLENQEYSNAEMRLNPGESLVLYTDGLSEARSPSGEFYGEGRIRSFLEGRNGQTTERLCNDLEKETCGFQEMNLADDLTILAIRRIGSRMTRMLEDLIKGKGT
jgi:sigma-B regulation protein RsbU (phosphoserine phosphatase)